LNKTSTMRIAIATAGRFHVLDLARELDALGHEVQFHSYVPRRRAEAFGLPGRCHVDHVPWLAPLLVWERAFPKALPALRERLLQAALNRSLIARMKPCDVFICMSGIYLEAATFARRRYGAKIVLVRGSKHIQVQDEILAALPGAQRPTPRSIQRELAGYQLADMIDVPSQHVVDSFIAMSPDMSNKVVRNPYGTDLKMFPPARHESRHRSCGSQVTFVFAGNWCLRKGCDLLMVAARAAGVDLVHVGPVGGDCPLPADGDGFKHVGKVDQSRLSDFYRSVDAMVLASREDGFGLVLAQGLATGLPIVCTNDTGGADLRHTSTLDDRIQVVPAGDPVALAQAMKNVAKRLCDGPPFPDITEEDRETLTWRAFGKRYEANLDRLLNGLQ